MELCKEVRKQMISHDEQVHDLAALLGIKYSQASRRLCGTVKFTVEDLEKIVKHYDLSADELYHLFFC